MVSLSEIHASNAQLPSFLPKQVVAVFAGATSGIGEATLKTFVRYAVEPRIYLFARNEASAERVIADCRQINPAGDFIFVQVDLSLIRETDRACEEVKSKEKRVNLVVLSAGEMKLDRSLTPEGLHIMLAASTYTRIRIAQQLLPLLTAAASTTSLARVLDVAGGTCEGEVNLSDITAIKAPLTQMRPHISSMHTLSLEVLAQQAPTVSFVHEFPGPVYTNLGKNGTETIVRVYSFVISLLHFVLGNWLFIPLEECGERHVFLATSKKYRPRNGNASGVAMEELDISKGTDGVVGSGVYSVNWDGKEGNEKAMAVLQGLRQKGVKEIVWSHIASEFDRIARSNEGVATET